MRRAKIFTSLPKQTALRRFSNRISGEEQAAAAMAEIGKDADRQRLEGERERERERERENSIEMRS